jgi:hypothetical protein
MEMKQLLAVMLCFLFSGCLAAPLGDHCEPSRTCSCSDPSFGPNHPELCALDEAGDGDTAVLDAGRAETSDGPVDAKSPTEEGSPAPGGESDASVALDGGGLADESSSEVGRELRDAAPAEAEAAVCDPTGLPTVSPCVVDEAFGVFVSPAGNDADAGAAGTRAAPMRTLARALSVAKSTGKRVYACDNGTGYAETITINAAVDGVALFGGFTCTDWTYSTTRRAVVRSPNGLALVVHGITAGVLVENFELDSPNAAAPGTSSIAGIVDTALAVVLRRVRIVAGTGAAGANGMNGGAGTNGAIAGAQQRGLAATCAANAGFSQSGGGWPAQSACGSRGGVGGTASTSSALPGATGTPQDGVNPPGVNNRGLENMPGQAGSPGNAGMLGMPASGTGTFSATGYVPPGVAGSGTAGLVGQGGGGGGSSDVPAQVINCLGASGGAGGMGGCGGAAGTGGAAGGASVALLVWTSQVTLDTCALVANNGGAGGTGGIGGPGGAGQAGGLGGGALTSAGGMIAAGGQGGPGGIGGAGGPGSGGNGGPSYALVFSGQTPTRTATSFLSGTGGAAGPGGTAALAGLDGGLVTASSGVAGVEAMEFLVP